MLLRSRMLPQLIVRVKWKVKVWFADISYYQQFLDLDLVKRKWIWVGCFKEERWVWCGRIWRGQEQQAAEEETSVAGADSELQFARDGRACRRPSPGPPGQNLPWQLSRASLLPSERVSWGAWDSRFGERIHTEVEASHQPKPSHHIEVEDGKQDWES